MRKKLEKILLVILILGPLFVLTATTAARSHKHRNLPKKVVTPPKTVGQLQSRIDAIITQAGPAFRVTGEVADLSNGNVLFTMGENSPVPSASILKLYTTSATLNSLPASTAFRTSIYATAQPDANGTVNGDIILYGRGDPSLTSDSLRNLAAQLSSRGIKKITGDVIVDGSYFNSQLTPPDRDPNDLQWYYGAQISSLPINVNSVAVMVWPGKKTGAPLRITMNPQTSYITINNTATTAASNQPKALTIQRGPNDNIISISGTLPKNAGGQLYRVAVNNPLLYASNLFKDDLASQGIAVNGAVRTVDANARNNQSLDTSNLTEVANLTSLPLSEIINWTNKHSDNLFAETLLRQLGVNFAQQTSPRATDPVDQLGLVEVKDYLKQAGIDPNNIHVSDGSGLDPTDTITHDSTIKLLRYDATRPFAQTLLDSLPIAGVDGTEHNHFQGTAAAGNLIAKTGEINGVDSLAGYVTTASGHRLVFSLAVQQTNGQKVAARKIIDQICILLAQYKGKT